MPRRYPYRRRFFSAKPKKSFKTKYPVNYTALRYEHSIATATITVATQTNARTSLYKDVLVLDTTNFNGIKYIKNFYLQVSWTSKNPTEKGIIYGKPLACALVLIPSSYPDTALDINFSTGAASPTVQMVNPQQNVILTTTVLGNNNIASVLAKKAVRVGQGDRIVFLCKGAAVTTANSQTAVTFLLSHYVSF